MADIGTKRAAELLGCTQSTINKWCREGKFKSATQDKEGSPWHIAEEEVLQFAKTRKKKNKK